MYGVYRQINARGKHGLTRNAHARISPRFGYFARQITDLPIKGLSSANGIAPQKHHYPSQSEDPEFLHRRPLVVKNPNAEFMRGDRG
jgi:hypothetical protein